MTFIGGKDMAALSQEASAAKKPVVISLGGSMLFDAKGDIDVKYARSVSSLLLELKRRGRRLAVVVGGGAVSRAYCDAVRELTGNEFYSDRVGIQGTRINAQVLVFCLGETAYPKVITDPDDAVHALQTGFIPVGGGMLEGMSTDADAVLVAERIGAAKLVNVSRVPGVYSADPKTNPKAKKFTEMTHAQLTGLATAQDSRKAKSPFVFDLIACKLAQRSNIEVHFVDGRDVKEIERAVLGEKHSGTIVRE
ncbi:MAG: UMP kinase [Candidatus Micrarchaeota archaeon]|nr:UMP kinase [Candidatus Micrarchaeota archaeon]